MAATRPAPRTGPAGRAVRRLAPHLPVALLVVAYFVCFSWLSVRIFEAYRSPGYDMGIFDQGVWLLSRFHAPFVTVMGRDLFGDHTSFVLLLAVPLYWIAPAAQTLLVLQSGLIAAAAVPVYLIARRRTASTALATGLAGAYLLNPALQNADLEQFHPECFLVLFIAVALFAALEWHPRLLAVSAVGCLLVKEDTALLVVPLGLWVYLRRDREFGRRLMAGAALYAVFATEVVIRLLLGTASFYRDRIPFGGLWGLVTAPFTRTGRFLSYLWADDRPWYLWQMGAAFGWMFLLGPDVAAIAALTVSENLLSTFPYMHRIYYHYSLALVPVLAVASAVAVGRVRPRRRPAATALVCAAAIASCAVWGVAPFSVPSASPSPGPGSPAVRATDALLRDVPPGAVVSASWPIVAHLTHRTRVYQWPTPFRATLWGLYRQEGQRLPSAATVRYLVIPAHRAGMDARVFDSIASRFRLMATTGTWSLYRRDAGQPPAPAAGAAAEPGDRSAAGAGPEPGDPEAAEPAPGIRR